VDYWSNIDDVVFYMNYRYKDYKLSDIYDDGSDSLKNRTNPSATRKDTSEQQTYKDLLRQIRAAIDCQISLHGGSGTPLHYFEDASKIGVSKININSDLRYAFRTTLEKVLRENPDEYAVFKLMPEVYDAVQKVVEEKIGAFGSAGKVFI